MSDLIDRQAVIDALCEDLCGGRHGCKFYPECENLKPIRHLPSAQPEIIHCRECKHKFIKNGVWNCPFGLPGGELFFCGYGNRREVSE